MNFIVFIYKFKGPTTDTSIELTPIGDATEGMSLRPCGNKFRLISFNSLKINIIELL